MAETIKASASTLRIVEWDELPPSVRDIPSDFNPLADGVLMAHQVDWLKLDTQIKVGEKGRRTGITFAEGLDAVLVAAARKSAGGMDVFYIGDTKEKGLEFIGYAAKFSRVIAAAQSSGNSEIEEFLFDDQDEHGNTRKITAYRIRYASGFKVVALSSNPANIRGLQGKVIIDEAAFHRDVQGVLDAATALLIWGGRISIVSTHNGRSNPFNQLVNDIRDGRYGDNAAVYRVTFDDAVANGLFERVCWMKGEAPTPEDKQQWYTQIRAAYGPRKAQMREELDAIPRDGNSVCIPGVWIQDAGRPDRPVLRLALDDAFVHQAIHRREGYVKDWLERLVLPVLMTLDPDCRHVFGMDFARHRHFSVFCPLVEHKNLHRSVPFVIEMHNVPSRQQLQIVVEAVRRLPRFSAGAMDATGSGETLAEDVADEFGRDAIHQIKLSRQWYGAWMPRMVQLFEDGVITLPADADLADDLRTIETVDGIPMISKLERKDLKDPDLVRHGDFGGALALAEFALGNMVRSPMAFAPIPGRHDQHPDDDDHVDPYRYGGCW